MAFDEGRELSIPVLHPKLDDSLCIVDTQGSQRMGMRWETGSQIEKRAQATAGALLLYAYSE